MSKKDDAGQRSPFFAAGAFDVVAIAASAGGLNALGLLLSGLSESFPAAVLVVQHLDPRHPSFMADILKRRTSLQVKEAEEGERLRLGMVFIAPPNRHMLVNPDATIALTQTELEDVPSSPVGTNAAYAMREQGGQLTIGLTDVIIDEESMAQNPEFRPGPYIKLTAADTGSGMTAEVQERIFEPFFTTKRRGEGTGMGLSVVRGIVQSHGGAIQVASIPGQGTTFDVYLPAASGAAAPTRPGAGTALKGKGRILFVDDEELLVRSVKSMLERLGFSVSSTTDPQEALTLFRDHPMDFDLVITDQTMPGLTGDRLARELLGIRPDVPIILSTGFSETVQEQELPSLGIRGFIMKPFSMNEIAEKIQAALKKA